MAGIGNQGYDLESPGGCVVVNPDGHRFTEFSCSFKWLSPFYFPFEKYHEADKHYVIDYTPLKRFLESNYACPIVAVTLYALFCYFGPKYMAKREAYSFRKTLAGWNLFLAIYSGMTVLRGLPAFYHVATNPLYHTLCVDPMVTYGGSMDVWTMLFVISKFAELIDTVFIVVHKKPLILLHWWHHISVLLYCWLAFQTKTPSYSIFGSVNACVHSVMYFYYFLMAVKMKPKWFAPIWITAFQLAQMVVGVSLNLATFYYYFTDDSCYVQKPALWACLLMYGSYLYLFGEFFYKRYVRAQPPTKKKKV